MAENENVLVDSADEQNTHDSADSKVPSSLEQPPDPDDALSDMLDGAAERMAGLPTGSGEPDRQAQTPDEGQHPEEPEKTPDTPPEAAQEAESDDAEDEINEDERQKGYLRQSDYTRKMQELSQQRKQIEQLTQDPRFLAAYQQVMQQQQPQNQQANQPQAQASDQPPDDPIEYAAWQAKREVMAEMMPMIQNLQQQVQIASAKSGLVGDNLAGTTQEAISRYIQQQPEALRPLIYEALDKNPQLYHGVYNEFRGNIEQTIQRLQNERRQPQQKQTAQRQAPPMSIENQRRVQQVAPATQSPGATAVENPELDRAHELAALSKNLLDGKVSDHDAALSRYLDLAGATDRL